MNIAEFEEAEAIVEVIRSIEGWVTLAQSDSIIRKDYLPADVRAQANLFIIEALSEKKDREIAALDLVGPQTPQKERERLGGTPSVPARKDGADPDETERPGQSRGQS